MVGTQNINEKTDKELIDGYLRGNGADFDYLYERHKRVVYGYLNGILPNQHAVIDDVFQQTWLKVLEKLPGYSCSNKFRAWIIKIAHNFTIDHFRKNKKFKYAVELDADDAPEIIDEVAVCWEVLDDTDIEASVESAIAELRPEQREVFVMRRNQLSFKEIAAIQNSSINTVLARMQYAIKNIKKQLSILDYSNGDDL